MPAAIEYQIVAFNGQTAGPDAAWTVGHERPAIRGAFGRGGEGLYSALSVLMGVTRPAYHAGSAATRFASTIEPMTMMSMSVGGTTG